ncbi:MAG: hypothetical protein J3Q66DRAFT_326256 [Benniella sp.]|nr:MAG: hypothetical protein J3Q66DRAFT_326256 [Benniella sp.]
MTNNNTSLAKLWPRFIVGLVAAHRLFVDPVAFVYAFLNHEQVRRHNPCDSQDPPSYFKQYSYKAPLCLSEEQEQIVKGFVIIIAVLTTLFNVIALYAVIGQSISATKISLKVWCSQMGFLLTTILLMSNEETGRAMNYLNQWQVLRFEHGLLTNLIYGWSLLVVLRDLRCQARDCVGRLLDSRIQLQQLADDEEVLVVWVTEKETPSEKV